MSSALMRTRFTALLPLAVAGGLALWGGEAKALTIRYSFTNPSPPSYTGGTIEVTSLNQTLGTSPVTFTVENGTTNTFAASFSTANSKDLVYGSVGSDTGWFLNDFAFGQSLSSNTTWGELLGTFNGTLGFPGQFGWRNLPSSGSEFGVAANSITFSVPVPGPLPVFGAAAAFGWSRRLRRNIQKREPLATTI
jgi:hypothetical protein